MPTFAALHGNRVYWRQRFFWIPWCPVVLLICAPFHARQWSWSELSHPLTLVGEKSLPLKDGDEPEPVGDSSLAPYHPAKLEDRNLEIRRARIAHCLAVYFDKPVDADRLRPWSIMHGLIAFGQRSQILVAGQRVNAAEYLCANGAGNHVRILTMENGKLHAKIGPGVQGHPGQLLAILAQAGVPADHPLEVEGHSMTLVDLIEYEMRGCRSKTELTFRLIALSHYLDPSSVWFNESGEKWSMARLVSEETQQAVEAGACGGTHRLMALSRSLRQLEDFDIPITGPWLQAERITDAYEERAWRYQNPDGSFSTQFFHGTGRDADLMRRIYSHGHILEWLAYKLPESRLDEPRMLAAVDYLVDTMLNAPRHEIDVGPRGHALHALAIYYQRRFRESLDADRLAAVANSVSPEELARSIHSDSKQAFGKAAPRNTASSQAAPSRIPPPRLIIRRR